jgi:hypothetical protein
MCPTHNYFAQGHHCSSLAAIGTGILFFKLPGNRFHLG